MKPGAPAVVASVPVCETTTVAAPDDTAFLDFFVDLEELEKQAAKVIDDDLAKGVEPRRIIRAARMIQDYEKMFWDAMARLSGI